ncbi:TPA: hypothetical protein HA251_05425 [Candidatus Woesearchaeota archaeon]|nr:hypothetical protein [Candidatus Woesearchaeota archaeon]
MADKNTNDKSKDMADKNKDRFTKESDGKDVIGKDFSGGVKKNDDVSEATKALSTNGRDSSDNLAKDEAARDRFNKESAPRSTQDAINAIEIPHDERESKDALGKNRRADLSDSDRYSVETPNKERVASESSTHDPREKERSYDERMAEGVKKRKLPTDT